MLIFERRAGERLQIGDEIEVRVLDTDGERVRIAVEAPRDVRVESVDDALETGESTIDTK
ncbi:Carbon storage regulator protein [Salinisphaera shabanensis E1L3A]|uniref:Carbon storage regulator protein n=1 Tax=Salinisphaera shabanensis E1L3A TaxID=1033802 RepID=U2G0I9_9GAMM|nr:carbon storage regulator [Salinisphaera shabanensis]ERJ19818.1 Carbon storage regulator protein [Salinisphaera shabanensis E1L3A]